MSLPVIALFIAQAKFIEDASDGIPGSLVPSIPTYPSTGPPPGKTALAHGWPYAQQPGRWLCSAINAPIFFVDHCASPRKTGAHAQCGPNGAFASTQALPAGLEIIDSLDDEDSLGWELASDDGSDESEPEEYWGQLPLPMTWEERMEKRAVQKEIAEKKHRIAEMRSAEYRLAGPVPKQIGKKNGPRSIGGMAECIAQVKCKALREDFQNGHLAISEAEFECQMSHLQARKPEPGKQLTIGDMFKKRPHAVSVSSDEIEISSGPVPTKRLKGDSAASSSIAAVELREEEEESSSGSESENSNSELGDDDEVQPELLEEEARSKEGDAAVESIVAADEIAEWVETVLEDAAPLHPSELSSLSLLMDGHERKDVKKRRKEYLAELEAADPFRPRYVEPDMAEIRREAEDEEPEHIFIVHANEQRYGLLDLAEEMVAENEALAELRLAFTKSTTVIYLDNKPGGDAYWNMEQMIAQLAKAISIARRMFPKAIIHWVFNNSSAHGSLAKNALTVTKMNVNPGGKVPEMQDTKLVFDNPLPDNHPHKKFEGQPKGMKVILAERGYTTNTNGKPLIGECKACKVSKACKPHLDGASTDEEAEMYGGDDNDSEEEEERPVDCCMQRLLSRQADFAGEKSQLELLIEAVPGMFCHLLPKFHPEMNPIEYFGPGSNAISASGRMLPVPSPPFEDSSAAPIGMQVFTATL
ncbi:hypothetical protein B0H13DRAFT_2655599 [Mycena leptocephala]|nr:hypothetical protein B0H13DRAFT_2655599 [Mycena leptocephala]